MSKKKKSPLLIREDEEDKNSYTFLDLWESWTGEDRHYCEYDGGSCANFGFCKDLAGLFFAARRFIRGRGGNLSGVKLKKLVRALCKKDSVFRSRAKCKLKKLPNISVICWLRKIGKDEDPKLTKLCGLDAKIYN